MHDSSLESMKKEPRGVGGIEIPRQISRTFGVIKRILNVHH